MDPRITSVLVGGGKPVEVPHKEQLHGVKRVPATVTPATATEAGNVNSTEKAAETATSQPVSEESLQELVEGLNVSQSLERTLRFSVDERAGRPVIKVVDRYTDEVIRQIPPEVALKISESLDAVTYNASAGVLLSELA